MKEFMWETVSSFCGASIFEQVYSVILEYVSDILRAVVWVTFKFVNPKHKDWVSIHDYQVRLSQP